MNNITKSCLTEVLLEAEGAELGNVECTEAPSEAFARRMQRLAEHPEKYSKNRRTKKIVIILIAAAVILTSCTAIKPIRTAIANFIVTIFEKGSFIDKSEDIKAKDRITEFYSPKFIPEGYELIEDRIDKFNENIIIGRYLKYTDDNKIMYFIQSEAKSTVTLDTENADIKTFMVNDVECMSSRNLNCYIVIWEQFGYRFSLETPKETTEETAKKIIESVEKIELTNN
ncbi:MAG: DUF4367 domain-containing protein [Clostridia bacterium]|nr:DUF4367 domain-containing protein [Clostridia bacterium]